jgi:hypothetical protein
VKNFCLIPLSVFFLLLTCHTWFGPDIWYHLTWGRDVLENGSFLPAQRSLFEQPFVANMYWFFQTSVYILYRSVGVTGVSVFFSALWLAIAFIWCRTAKVTQGFLGPLVFLAFAICMQLRFDQRPEVYAYLFLITQIAFLVELEKSEQGWKWKLPALVILQVLMVNSHGYFALGPMLGGAFLVSVLISKREKLWLAISAFSLLAVASFVSPSPLGVWEMVVGYEKIGRAMSETNVEMFPTYRIDLTWSLQTFWIYWIAIVAAIVWKIWRKQFDFSFILAVAGAFLGAKMLRNIPLFILFAAPLTSQLVSLADPFFGWMFRKHRSRLLYHAGVSLFAAYLCLFVARGDYHRGSLSLSEFGYGLEWASYPIGATSYLKQIGFQGRVFTDSYDGGYVEFQMPNVKIAGDSYFYDWPTTEQFFAAIKKPEALAAANERFHFDALLLNIENVDIVQSLWRSPDWVYAYADSHRILFLRSDRFARYLVPTSKPIYYQGQDLRHWMNAFAPITWMQTALRYGDQGLARKLLNDYQIAAAVPSTFVRAALLFAVTQQDPFVAKKALELWPRSYPSHPGDAEAIEKLSRTLGVLK